MRISIRALFHVAVALPWFLAAACTGGDEPAPPATSVTSTPAVPAVPPPPPTYQVSLHRPSKVGDLYNETTTVKKHEAQLMKMGQKVENEVEDRQVELVAKVQVLATDALGQPTSARYTITRLEAGPPGAPLAPVVPPGQVLTIVRGEPPSITLEGGGALTEQQTKDIKTVISVGPVVPITDDQVFGTTTPQLVGATWPINAQLGAAGLSDEDLTVAPEGLSGQSKLVSVRPEAGVECLEVTVSFLAKSLQFNKLPPGSTVTGQMSVDLTGLFPTDATRQPLSQTSTTRGQFNMILFGGAATSDMQLEETKTTTRAPAL